MNEIELDSWEDFEKEVKRLEEERAKLAESSTLTISDYLYRGQSDHRWTLETTLERYIPEQFSLLKYFRLVMNAQPQVETFTEEEWEDWDFDELRDFSSSRDLPNKDGIPAYDYLIYLRHHRFPSPLLDWTRSPYVAAYFAFADEKSDRVAIYVYQEHAGYGKSGSSDDPRIIGFGPYVRSHSRHFLQQSQYTVACQYKQDEWWYASHEDVLAKNSEEQDLSWKFTIPITERVKVLKILDQYNLNAFSLFQSEESLLETIALRELVFLGL